jgi:hypothetical protein
MIGLPTRIATFLSSDKAVQNSHRNILTEFGERSGNLAWVFAGSWVKLAPQIIAVGWRRYYSPENLHDQFGEGFKIVDIAHETHRIPFGTEQKFMYHYCCKD